MAVDTADLVGLFQNERLSTRIDHRKRCNHRAATAAHDHKVGALVPISHAAFPLSFMLVRFAPATVV